MARDMRESGNAYEAYAGQWSREVAAHLLGWLAVPSGRRWLDAGYGSGALTAAIRSAGHPALIAGVDPSLDRLRRDGRRRRRHWAVAGEVTALPLAANRFDVVVSGLALSLGPNPETAIAEFVRVAVPGGLVAAYVWDYAEGMRMTRLFWDAATAIDPAAADLDECQGFALCEEKPLAEAWAAAGLGDVATRLIEIPTVFAGFAAFWRPLLVGPGAAPTYLASLTPDHRAAIRELLHARLGDRTIMLTAAAWAVKGFKDI